MAKGKKNHGRAFKLKKLEDEGVMIEEGEGKGKKGKKAKKEAEK